MALLALADVSDSMIDAAAGGKKSKPVAFRVRALCRYTLRFGCRSVSASSRQGPGSVGITKLTFDIFLL